MTAKNPYESLKIPFLDDAVPVEAKSMWTITDSRDETITISTARLSDNMWVYGYIVNWANGRTSCQRPTAELGKFRSQREARLYAIGFMLLYLKHFTEATQSALRKAERKLLQIELF